MSDIEDEPPPVLLPCSICSRTFRPEVLDRHSKVCEKTASKKRRVFDSFKSRVSGTELEEFLGPAPLPGQPLKRPEKSPVKKSRGPPKWKETHENLIAVLRAARGAATADPSAVLVKNAGNEQCPSCGRFFGPRAFDRHVQFCKEKTSRIKMTPTKVSQAQERLEARTKYKAPLSLKPKLTTKEKYSPMLPRKADSTETCLISTSSKTSLANPLGKPAKPTPVRQNVSNFSRDSPTRASERQRSISPKKPLPSSSKVAREPQGKHFPQPKIKDSLKDTEDLRPRTGMKVSSRQDKLRKSGRNISNYEDESPPSNKMQNNRDKSTRRCYMSSDDGNDTDTNLSIYSIGTCGSEKTQKKESQKTQRGSVSPVAQAKRSGQGKERGTSEPEEQRSSRRSKKRLPTINDLSVNDESFGIRVAPCPHRSPNQRKSSAKKGQSPTGRKDRADVGGGECDRKDSARTKAKLELVLPRIPALNRSSRIPKPVLRNGKKSGHSFRDDEPDCESFEDPSGMHPESPEPSLKKSLRKWHDISKVSTSELLNMTDELDLMCDLDGFDLANDGDTYGSDSEELSRSALLELVGEDQSKADDSLESKGDIQDEPQRDRKEDEFIVLHIAEPERLTDDDMNMKLSISEPCFKTNYTDPKTTLLNIMKNSNVFVFNSASMYAKRRNPTVRPGMTRKAKKVNVMPRTSFIRERTFFADDYPKIKRRKISGREEPLPLPIINNPSGYECEDVSGVGKDRRRSSGRKLSDFSQRDFPVGSRERGSPDGDETVNAAGKKSAKKFEYFEIGADFGDEERDNPSGCEEVDGCQRKQSGGKSLKKVKKGEEGGGPKCGRGQKKKGKDPGEAKKCVICYSDEEFEELRRRKEDCLSQMNPREESQAKEEDELPEFPVDDVASVAQGPRSSPVGSPEVLNPLEDIAEEHSDAAEDSIKMEDFIVRKPRKANILRRNGGCLEKLFPKPPEISQLKTRRSSTVIPLNYTLDSLYDLKDEENVDDKTLMTRVTKPVEGGVKLPALELSTRKQQEKGDSISSLVQKWVSRRQMIQNGTLCGSKLASTELYGAPKKPIPFQTELLPLVLTQKLAEVAEQFDKGKLNDDGYDPFKQAERQMLALLSWPSTADLKSTTGDRSQSPKPLHTRSLNLETSPSSAFTKYPSKVDKTGKEAKENANLKKAQDSSADSGKRSGGKEYTPVYSAADDWEEIFEKHFDLNRNEMNDKMTRSVKSALDGLMKGSRKSMNASGSSSEKDNSPTRHNRSDFSEGSVMDDILYTSTPKRASSRMSSAAEPSFDSSGRKTPAFHRKAMNPSYGRITPPDDFSDSPGKEDHGGRKSNRNSGVSLSSLSFCSQASDTTLADEEIMRANLEIIGVGKGTPRSGKRRFARSQSVFDERNKMLFAKTFDHNFSSSDENEMLPSLIDKQGKKSTLVDPHPKSIPSHFPRSQSVTDGRFRGDGDHSEDRDLVSSPEACKNRKAKISGDSAYSSLNRRSPRVGTKKKQQEDRLSSSGSEHSLPPLGNDHALKPVSLNFDNTAPPKTSQPYKMSKFCHECGSKYPVAVAKFCCECGVRRLII